ncbi:dipeptide epimerase [Sphingobium algorifonticola]|uniref:Dipeptide epimerase n=1 Tax=Sphingobium algorifonticola TaxID=2008318 RepID=A0A437J669_9SPHN|nr:dipeptide epimerase [Sphingobium algorifonticola]RVT40273.1 dipeptide epimerase [Sphingobium algorifonticola]
MSSLRLTVETADLALKSPFRISGHVFSTSPILTVTLTRGDIWGRGEAAGVYYVGDTPAKGAAQIEQVRAAIEAGIDRDALRTLLPPGGARNAVDAALWELEARETGRPVWALAGLDEPRPLLTTVTLGADDPAVMVERATGYGFARALKLKLTGETDADIARVRAVRAARPDVWMGVDPNQGYTPDTIERLIPVLVACGVSLLEQPFRRGHEAELDGFDRVIPVAADESCLDLAELETLPGRFDVVNIKLDKCGGLTEGLMIARRAQQLGLKVMVGNMVGSSLAAAPGFILGQLCDIVDLDGPLFITQDVVPGVRYDDGLVWSPAELWGADARIAATAGA